MFDCLTLSFYKTDFDVENPDIEKCKSRRVKGGLCKSRLVVSNVYVLCNEYAAIRAICVPEGELNIPCIPQSLQGSRAIYE
jgi:hypothetical protein